MTGEDLVRAARALIGVRFRLHGRDPAIGLDCVGLFGAALASCGAPAHLPSGYSLRSSGPPDVDAVAASLGFDRVSGLREPGDLVMLQVAAWQYHFALASEPHSIVHAHAGLGQVVEGSLPDAWAIVGHWRLGPALAAPN